MDGKLVSLLKTFSKIELNRLKDFIYSPYFNKQKYVTGMFDEIIKHYPEFSSENFTKEKFTPGFIRENHTMIQDSETLLLT